MSESLRDEVIAGLRERGWPEPEPMMGKRFWYVDGDKSRSTGLSFDAEARDIVWTTPDGLENGKIDYHVHAPASRIIEAIDRLRWVIGLPARMGEFVSLRPAERNDIIDEAQQELARLDAALGETVGKGYTAEEAAAIMRQQFGAPLAKLVSTPEGLRIELADGAQHRIPDIDMSDRGLRGADRAAGLGPLPPSKPEPKPERPYDPRKIGEF